METQNNDTVHSEKIHLQSNDFVTVKYAGNSNDVLKSAKEILVADCLARILKDTQTSA